MRDDRVAYLAAAEHVILLPEIDAPTEMLLFPSKLSAMACVSAREFKLRLRSGRAHISVIRRVAGSHCALLDIVACN